MRISLEFSGGLESLFSSKRQIHIESLPAQISTIQHLLPHMRDTYLSPTANPDLFMLPKDGNIRPGVLVLINDCDWEVEGGLDYELQDGDILTFISTLHDSCFTLRRDSQFLMQESSNILDKIIRSLLSAHSGVSLLLHLSRLASYCGIQSPSSAGANITAGSGINLDLKAELDAYIDDNPHLFIFSTATATDMPAQEHDEISTNQVSVDAVVEYPETEMDLVAAEENHLDDALSAKQIETRISRSQRLTRLKNDVSNQREFLAGHVSAAAARTSTPNPSLKRGEQVRLDVVDNKYGPLMKSNSNSGTAQPVLALDFPTKHSSSSGLESRLSALETHILSTTTATQDSITTASAVPLSPTSIYKDLHLRVKRIEDILVDIEDNYPTVARKYFSVHNGGYGGGAGGEGNCSSDGKKSTLKLSSGGGVGVDHHLDGKGKKRLGLGGSGSGGNSLGGEVKRLRASNTSVNDHRHDAYDDDLDDDEDDLPRIDDLPDAELNGRIYSLRNKLLTKK